MLVCFSSGKCFIWMQQDAEVPIAISHYTVRGGGVLTWKGRGPDYSVVYVSSNIALQMFRLVSYNLL